MTSGNFAGWAATRWEQSGPGSYRLLDEIRAAHAGLEIEWCSSGGRLAGHRVRIAAQVMQVREDGRTASRSAPIGFPQRSQVP